MLKSQERKAIFLFFSVGIVLTLGILIGAWIQRVYSNPQCTVETSMGLSDHERYNYEQLINALKISHQTLLDHKQELNTIVDLRDRMINDLVLVAAACELQLEIVETEVK